MASSLMVTIPIIQSASFSFKKWEKQIDTLCTAVLPPAGHDCNHSFTLRGAANIKNN